MVKVLDIHTIKKLEFDKVKTALKSFAANQLGLDVIEALKPDHNFAQIEKALKETDEMMLLLERGGKLPLGGVKDIKAFLAAGLKGFLLGPSEFFQIRSTLYACRKVVGFFDYLKAEKDLLCLQLASYKNSIGDFSQLERNIDYVLDERGEIRDSASPTLQNIRRQQQKISQRIRDRLDSFLTNKNYEKMIQDPVITIRGERYVIPIKADFRSSFPGILHDRSASGQTLFIEPQAVVEMNNNLKDLEKDEQKEIERIFRQLIQELNQQAPEIEAAVDALQLLDFIQAKGLYGRANNCVIPQLRQGGPIDLKKARHPLINAQQVVPIDAYLGDTFNTLVITGPNTGGKTVSLKTVGLLCLMGQAGMPIPAAAGSTIGVFRGIYADIGDEQSIEQSLSTFSSHMTQIVRILEMVKANDLVLLDEVGAGTDPEEGAALAMAILNYLHQRQVLTVATTHYTELKAYAYTQAGLENAAVEFDLNSLSPTYRLLIGIPGRSNAFAIARRLGLREDIIEQAKSTISTEHNNLEGMISRIEKEEYALLDERDQLRKKIAQLEASEKKLRQKEQEQRESYLKTITEVQDKAQAVLKAIKAEGGRLLKEIRSFGGPDADRLADRFNKSLKEQELKLEDFKKPSLEEDSTLQEQQDLKLGAKVQLSSINQAGRIQEIEGTKAKIQVGVMQIWANLKELQLVDETDQAQEKSKLGKIQGRKAQNIPYQLDLRGMRWDEACEKIEKYLDDAYLAGLKQVYIVHGKGTGALRKASHELLNGNKNVSSYRLGGAGEGGVGATVVDLKD